MFVPFSKEDEELRVRRRFSGLVVATFLLGMGLGAWPTEAETGDHNYSHLERSTIGGDGTSHYPSCGGG